MTRVIHGVEVTGVEIGPRSECFHYHSERDILAIQFPCCGSFYCCYECHRSLADHVATTWPESRFGELALLCGACGKRMRIDEYMANSAECLSCHGELNPGCKFHWHLYFSPTTP